MLLRRIAQLAVLFVVGCAGTAGGFARGAYGVEHEPLRTEIRGHVDAIVATALEDVTHLRADVREANAIDPGVGTGALVQVILLKIALESAKAGELETESTERP